MLFFFLKNPFYNYLSLWGNFIQEYKDGLAGPCRHATLLSGAFGTQGTWCAGTETDDQCCKHSLLLSEKWNSVGVIETRDHRPSETLPSPHTSELRGQVFLLYCWHWGDFTPRSVPFFRVESAPWNCFKKHFSPWSLGSVAKSLILLLLVFSLLLVVKWKHKHADRGDTHTAFPSGTKTQSSIAVLSWNNVIKYDRTVYALLLLKAAEIKEF